MFWNFCQSCKWAQIFCVCADIWTFFRFTSQTSAPFTKCPFEVKKRADRTVPSLEGSEILHIKMFTLCLFVIFVAKKKYFWQVKAFVMW